MQSKLHTAVPLGELYSNQMQSRRREQRLRKDERTSCNQAWLMETKMQREIPSGTSKFKMHLQFRSI